MMNAIKLGLMLLNFIKLTKNLNLKRQNNLSIDCVEGKFLVQSEKDCSKISENLPDVIEKNLSDIEIKLAQKYSIWNNSCRFISR